MVSPDKQIFGLTGEIGRDGILTPEQQLLLNQIQHDAAKTVQNYLDQKEAGKLFPIAAMATGIGKTKVEHQIIEDWRKKNPQAKILFIAGTKLTLVDQSSQALSNYQLQNASNNDNSFTESEGLEVDNIETEDIEETLITEQKDLPLYRIGKFRDTEADVQIATIQTIQSAYKNGQLNFAEFGLVIVDEVHNIGTPLRSAIIKQFQNVVGFTATPNRHSGPQKTPNQYGFEIAYNLPLPEAQESRLLPPLLGMQVDTTGLVDEIPINMSGLIDYKRLEQILKQSPDLRPFIADKVAKIIKDGEKEYKTVIAVNFVWEAQELAQLLNDRGIKVGVAVNQVASKQIHTDEIPALGSIDRYKLPREDPKSIQVLISPYVASEGFDAPFTEVLVWASPTDSDLRYTQYVGRLARRSEGKLFGLNLDFLYQTSQYNWSYNMGMWMKGNVKQLSSGLLYLGPEQDIAGLNNLDVVKNMREKADRVDISDLQQELVQDLQDTDLPLTGSIIKFFIGSTSRILAIAQQVKDELRSEYSEYFTRRNNNTKQINVVTTEGKETFIEAMKEKGIELRNPDIEEVQKDDLPLTYLLYKDFIGHYMKIIPIAQQVKDELITEHPEYFAKRKDHSTFFDVVTASGRETFQKAMEEKGIELRNPDIEEVKKTDLPLITKSIATFFIGDREKLWPIMQQVRDTLKSKHPEYFAKRKIKANNYSQYIDVVTITGREAFYKAIQEQGIELRNPDIEEVKKTDLPLTRSGNKLFIGKNEKIMPIAQQVKDELITEHPEYFAKRTNHSMRIDVVTAEGRDTFIQAILEAGVKLKQK